MAEPCAYQDDLKSHCAHKGGVFCVGGVVGEDFDYGSA